MDQGDWAVSLVPVVRPETRGVGGLGPCLGRASSSSVSASRPPEPPAPRLTACGERASLFHVSSRCRSCLAMTALRPEAKCLFFEAPRSRPGAGKRSRPGTRAGSGGAGGGGGPGSIVCLASDAPWRPDQVCAPTPGTPPPHMWGKPAAGW